MILPGMHKADGAAERRLRHLRLQRHVLQQRLGREPKLSELAEETGLSAEEIAFAMKGRPRAKEKARVSVRTFGEFDVLLDGRPIIFERARAKELLAFLIDRQGGFVTRANVFSALWENGLYDRSMQKQLDVVIRSLRNTLEHYGIGDIIEIQKGSLRAVPEKLDCDLYRFFDGDANAAESYRGEYMNAYSWASLTESYMDRIN